MHSLHHVSRYLGIFILISQRLIKYIGLRFDLHVTATFSHIFCTRMYIFERRKRSNGFLPSLYLFYMYMIHLLNSLSRKFSFNLHVKLTFMFNARCTDITNQVLSNLTGRKWNQIMNIFLIFMP